MEIPLVHSTAKPEIVAPLLDPLGSLGSLDRREPGESGTATKPRTILVDGFNVLHAVLLGKDRAKGWWQRVHRERLLERLCEWRGGPDQIWVAFDGTRPAESIWAEPVAIVHSDMNTGRSPGQTAKKIAPTIHSVYVESADDWIVRRARKSSDPTNMIVVSADRQVAGRARSAGCEVLAPWTFMSGCGPAPGTFSASSPASFSANSSANSSADFSADASAAEAEEESEKPS